MAYRTVWKFSSFALSTFRRVLDNYPKSSIPLNHFEGTGALRPSVGNYFKLFPLLCFRTVFVFFFVTLLILFSCGCLRRCCTVPFFLITHQWNRDVSEDGLKWLDCTSTRLLPYKHPNYRALLPSPTWSPVGLTLYSRNLSGKSSPVVCLLSISTSSPGLSTGSLGVYTTRHSASLADGTRIAWSTEMEFWILPLEIIVVVGNTCITLKCPVLEIRLWYDSVARPFVEKVFIGSRAK